MKAYPIMYKHPTTGLIVEHEGMELRDWFAGMAMQSMLSTQTDNSVLIDLLAISAYRQADEMIKAREIKND
jgi:hypothetical protein